MSLYKGYPAMSRFGQGIYIPCASFKKKKVHGSPRDAYPQRDSESAHSLKATTHWARRASNPLTLKVGQHGDRARSTGDPEPWLLTTASKGRESTVCPLNPPPIGQTCRKSKVSKNIRKKTKSLVLAPGTKGKNFHVTI